MEFSLKRTWMSIAVCFIISQLMKYLLKNFEPHDHIAKTFLTTKQITMNPNKEINNLGKGKGLGRLK